MIAAKADKADAKTAAKFAALVKNENLLLTLDQLFPPGEKNRLATALRTAFESINIQFAAQIVALNEADFAYLPNVGEKCIALLDERLAAHGLVRGETAPYREYLGFTVKGGVGSDAPITLDKDIVAGRIVAMFSLAGAKFVDLLPVDKAIRRMSKAPRDEVLSKLGNAFWESVITHPEVSAALQHAGTTLRTVMAAKLAERFRNEPT